METATLQSLIIQIPILAGFMWFMLRWQTNQQNATSSTHEVWQRWLDEQNDKSKNERDEWRAWLKARDEAYIEENKNVVVVLRHLERKIDISTNLSLMIYSSVSRGDENLEEHLEKWGLLLKDLTADGSV